MEKDMPIRDAPDCQEKSRVPRETGSAVFCTVLVRRNGSKKMCSRRSSPCGGGEGGKMLDPSCLRVRSEDRKKTSDLVFG